MSASQAVIVVGISLVILSVMITVMVRVNRTSRQRIERRREAWKAAGNEGPDPADEPGGSLYRIDPDFPRNY